MADHRYHALYWHFGPFGRQDVHLHPCITHTGCHWEMVGDGRECHGTDALHVEKRLNVGSAWVKPGAALVSDAQPSAGGDPRKEGG